MNARTARRAAIVGAFLVLGGLGLERLLSFLICHQPASGWTLDRVERLIDEELRLGWSREQGEAWFDRHAIRAFFTGVDGYSRRPPSPGSRHAPRIGWPCGTRRSRAHHQDQNFFHSSIAEYNLVLTEEDSYRRGSAGSNEETGSSAT